MGAVAKFHAGKHSQINQPRLLGAADYLHLQAQFLAQFSQETEAIGGLPHGAGGHTNGLLHPMATGQVAAVAEGQAGAIHGRRG